MTKFELSLTPNPKPTGKPIPPAEPEEPTRQPQPPQEQPEHPLIGYFAVGFGLAGVFTHGVVFVPLALMCSIAALIMRETVWGIVGLMLTVMGFLTTPIFLMLVGLKLLQVYLTDIYEGWLEWFSGIGM